MKVGPSWMDSFFPWSWSCFQVCYCHCGFFVTVCLINHPAFLHLYLFFIILDNVLTPYDAVKKA